MQRHLWVVGVILLLATAAWPSAAQLSKPIAKNEDLEKRSKFLDREALDLEQFVFGVDATTFSPNPQCAYDVDILWSVEAGASVYSTPIITDLYSDGTKDVVLASFNRFLEALDGNDGDKAPGWPFTSVHRVFHASPLVYDIDHDGVGDLLFATGNGEVFFVRENGVPFLGYTLVVPRLRVRKDWYVGLDDTHVDAAMSLHGGTKTDDKKAETEAEKEKEKEKEKEDEAADDPMVASAGVDIERLRERLERQASNPWAGMEGWLTEEAVESFEVLFSNDRQALGGLADDPLLYGRNRDTQKKEEGYVLVDPHILSTPTIADLDGDGMDELVVAVSYFFDREQYQTDSKSFSELDVDVDMSKYVAGGIVVFDLDTLDVKWQVHLDLTTEETQYRAYIYSSPTVVDIDRDGKMEIIVGTSVGFIYVLEHDGALKKGFPLLMAEIQGQVAVADVNQDGELEIVAVDSNGNVGCFNSEGQEVWEARMSGFSPQGPSIGDIDGDGTLDVVVATVPGHIWAFSGDSGEVLQNFPVKTSGRILSPVLLIRLFPDQPQLQLVVPAFDGYVYIVDGKTGCTEKIDIGENTYSMVLADDLDGNGRLDLLVSTMNGNIIALSTPTPFEPLRAWTSQVPGGNVFETRENYHGIHVTGPDRSFRDVQGSSMVLQFQIVDNRPPTQKPRQYDVHVSLGGKGGHTLLRKQYDAPGTYSEVIPCPTTATYRTVVVHMENEHRQIHMDRFSVAFNRYFYKMIKWIVVIPFTTMAAVLLFVKNLRTPLPT